MKSEKIIWFVGISVQLLQFNEYFVLLLKCVRHN